MARSKQLLSVPDLHGFFNINYLNTFFLVLAALTYLFVVRQLRFKRTASHAAHLDHAALSSMSIQTAQQIYSSLFDCEFPFMFMKGIQLALFRTYAIPSISSLLVRTTLLSNSATIPKRYTDTEALFIEFTLREWGSTSWLRGMARTKAIHAGYRKAGKVTDADMLYTIAALATQPPALITQWEWRDLTDTERCAIGVLYRGITEALDVPWEEYLRPFTSPPPSLDETKPKPLQLTSGLDFYHALLSWQSSYEGIYMRPHPANHTLAVAAIDLLLLVAPTAALKSLGKAVLTTLMDQPLRNAMSLPAPNQVICALVSAALNTRAFILRHITLPRPYFLRIQRTWSPKDSNNMCPFPSYNSSPSSSPSPSSLSPQQQRPTYLNSYIAAPYYVRPTRWNRWLNPGAWVWWARGLPLPGDKGEHYCPGGYLPENLGPKWLGGGGEQEKAEKEVWEKAMGNIREGII